MRLLHAMLLPELCVCSTSVQEKSRSIAYFETCLGWVLDEYVELVRHLACFPNQTQLNMDHTEGLRKIFDKSDEPTSKAAKAAVFVAREIYQTEEACSCLRIYR